MLPASDGTNVAAVVLAPVLTLVVVVLVLVLLLLAFLP